MAIALGVCEALVRWVAPPRNVGPSFSRYDAVYGKRLKESFRFTRITPEFRMEMSTNSLGFRGPEPASQPRGAVIFLGDSFTMGYGVDDGEEYPEVVRRLLGVAVINAGMGDAGNGHWVKFLRREAATYGPRLVVLQVCGNDFRDNAAEANGGAPVAGGGSGPGRGLFAAFFANPGSQVEP